MIFPFSFEGEIRRLPYAVWSSAIFFSQHLLTIIAFRIAGTPLEIDWRFLFVPLRSFVTQTYASSPTLLLVFVYLLAVSWALAGLAFRRAANADVGGWIAAAAMVPFIQVPTIGSLSLLPAPAAGAVPAPQIGITRSGWASAAHGVIVGIALTLLAVALSTLAFRSYGYGVFVLAPFVIGVAAAWIANRHSDIGAGLTAQVVTAATGLGAVGLVLAALEGVICIVLASPLGIGMALIGGLLGRAIALSRQRSARQGPLPGLIVLPIAFALEVVLPPATDFATRQAIDVAAPPEIVWDSIVNMERIGEPSALPFRLGVAYPLGGEIVGEGVGAVRRGEFSTGIAIERVTEWIPNRKLAFVVVEDVPSMREVSPYESLHTPHLIGYFETRETSFELLENSDGGTQIVEHTKHLLKLDPVLYWLPLARWIVHENNMRVLDHIKRQAEAHGSNIV